MKAFVLKDRLGDIKKGWIVRAWQPNLTRYDHMLIDEQGFYLEQVSVEEALSSKPRAHVASQKTNVTHH